MENKNSSSKKAKPIGASGHRARMFEKLISTNGEAISPRDTLEMLLYFPIRVRDTRDIAVELMERFDNSLENILTSSAKELCETPGVGPSVASFLNLVGMISQNLSNTPKPLPSGAPTDERISEVFGDMREEIHGDELWAILVDTTSDIADVFRVMDEFDYPTEDNLYFMMQNALRCRAAGIILAHVTESMEVFPTTKDTKFLTLMKNLLSATNLMLLDYYIVGGDEILKMTGLDSPYKQE